MRISLTFTTTDSVQGFWFFENILDQNTSANSVWWFQSPRGDFGFLKAYISVVCTVQNGSSFNPLAGILVF